MYVDVIPQTAVTNSVRGKAIIVTSLLIMSFGLSEGNGVKRIQGSYLCHYVLYTLTCGIYEH